MRSWLIVVLVATGAAAAPRYGHVASTSHDPAIVEAERLWGAASVEHDRRAQSVAWRKAADAFIAVAQSATVSHADQLATARASMAAIKNAIDVDPRIAPENEPDPNRVPTPAPIGEDDQRLIHAAELYVQLDPDSSEAIGATFVRANVLRRYDHLEEANEIFLDIFRRHPEHEVAEYAASLALDSLNRLHHYDELVTLAEEMLADKALVAKHSELGGLLVKIHAQHLRREAEQLERAAHETGDLASFDRCGEAYLALATPKAPGGDELLYNAQVCFENGGSVAQARATGKRSLTEYPKSRIAFPVLGRLARLESDVGNFESSASLLEAMAARAPKEKEVPYALLDAFVFRLALGQLDLADADLRLAEKMSRNRKVELASATISLVAAQLAAGHRAAAMARAKDLTGDHSSALARGKLLAELACPVPLVAELCPQPRDRKLFLRAQAELRRLSDADDPGDLGRRILLDLELEEKPPDRRDLAKRYRELTGPSDPAEMRIVAHARLALLAKLDHQIDEAANELSICITETRDLLAGASWAEYCERERAGLPRPPVLAPLHERIGTPSAGFKPASEVEVVRMHHGSLGVQ